MKKIIELQNWRHNLLFQFIIGIILFTIISLFEVSCCTMKGCMGVNDLGTIMLKNFDSSDVDSVFVVSCIRGSGFRIVEDSFMVQKVILPSNDSSPYTWIDMFLWGDEINIKYDYQIYFTNIDRSYKIAGFKTIKDECNSCSPGFIKDYYTRLNGYELNGKFKPLGYLEIDKEMD